MKRNRNFLLIVWAASLLGLSAVQTAHAAKGYYIPDELAVFETYRDSTSKIKDGQSGENDVHGLLSPKDFNRDLLKYNLTSAYKSKLLLLAFLWKVADGTQALDSAAAPIKVFADGKEIERYERKGSAETFLKYAGDNIYVIPFGLDMDSIKGRVEVDLTALGEGIRIYEAVIKRGDADDITALRWIRITDSIRKDGKPYQDIIFNKEAAGEDGMLQAEDNWVVSFKDLDKPTGDARDRGRADTLYFQKFEAHSQVFVIKNGTDTLDDKGESLSRDDNSGHGYEVTYDHIGRNAYKVKIDAGNRYTIAVTAKDSVTRGFYHFTLLDDTIRKVPSPNESGYDSIKYRLKDLYVYATDNPNHRYELIADSSGKVGFREDTITYRVTVTAPWDLLEVGYDFHDKDAFDEAKKNVVPIKYVKTASGERFIEVRVLNSEQTNQNDRVGKGKSDTTYTIRVLSGNRQLKSLRLSSDREGTKLIELTLDSTGKKYTSAAVDYTVPSVYAWASVEDAKAQVKGEGWELDTAKNAYKRLLPLKHFGRGGKHTFNVPVWAEDTILKTAYVIDVMMKWNPNLYEVTFLWTNQQENEGHFIEPALKTESVFNVKIPASVVIEDIRPNVAITKNKDDDEVYFRKFERWEVNNGVYSYVVKVTAKEDGTTKTYTFNLLHPSSDATLSYLYVPGFELSPAFAPSIEAYTVIVPSEQASINFIAQTSHKDATVEGNREHTLRGDSTFKIVVTAEDGTTKKTYTVTVTDGTHTGIQLAGGSSVQVYVSNQSLHVSTPAAERVSVYSAGGQLLYSLDKPAGKAFVSTFPKGVLIVKGSSGWVKKVALH
jgi:hypothetical protein